MGHTTQTKAKMHPGSYGAEVGQATALSDSLDHRQHVIDAYAEAMPAGLAEEYRAACVGLTQSEAAELGRMYIKK